MLRSGCSSHTTWIPHLLSLTAPSLIMQAHPHSPSSLRPSIGKVQAWWWAHVSSMISLVESTSISFRLDAWILHYITIALRRYLSPLSKHLTLACWVTFFFPPLRLDHSMISLQWPWVTQVIEQPDHQVAHFAPLLKLGLSMGPSLKWASMSLKIRSATSHRVRFNHWSTLPFISNAFWSPVSSRLRWWPLALCIHIHPSDHSQWVKSSSSTRIDDGQRAHHVNLKHHSNSSKDKTQALGSILD